jgi:hypothetical protein
VVTVIPRNFQVEISQLPKPLYIWEPRFKTIPLLPNPKSRVTNISPFHHSKAKFRRSRLPSPKSLHFPSQISAFPIPICKVQACNMSHLFLIFCPEEANVVRFHDVVRARGDQQSMDPRHREIHQYVTNHE